MGWEAAPPPLDAVKTQERTVKTLWKIQKNKSMVGAFTFGGFWERGEREKGFFSRCFFVYLIYTPKNARKNMIKKQEKTRETYILFICLYVYSFYMWDNSKKNKKNLNQKNNFSCILFLCIFLDVFFCIFWWRILYNFYTIVNVIGEKIVKW